MYIRRGSHSYYLQESRNKKEDEHITNPFLILLLMEEILDLSEFAGRPLEDTYFKEPSSGSNRGIAQIYTSLYPSLDHLYLTLT